MNVVFRISGGINFWDAVEDSDTGHPSWITVTMEYAFAFQYWYRELCVENQWGKGRKHCFVNFFLWRSLNRWWMRGGYVGWKSYLGPAETTSFSSGDSSRSNKHDTFWHVLSTGYFYVFMDHCCFRFSSLRNL